MHKLWEDRRNFAIEFLSFLLCIFSQPKVFKVCFKIFFSFFFIFFGGGGGGGAGTS